MKAEDRTYRELHKKVERALNHRQHERRLIKHRGRMIKEKRQRESEEAQPERGTE